MISKPGQGVTVVELVLVGLLIATAFTLVLPRLGRQVENEHLRLTQEIAQFIANDDSASLAAALKRGNFRDARLPNGISLLHIAAESTNYEAVKLLLEHGLVIDFETDAGWTPLHFALAYPNPGSSYDDQLRLVTLLLDEGANVNARTEEGRTPLYLAARKMERSFAALMIESGNPDTMLGFFNHIAATERAKDYRKISAIAGLLIERGADVSASEAIGDVTSLHVAAGAGATDTVRLLLKNGADVDAAVERTGETPLSFAARAGSLETVQVLLEAGADVNAVAGELKMTLAEMANYSGRERAANPIH